MKGPTRKEEPLPQPKQITRIDYENKSGNKVIKRIVSSPSAKSSTPTTYDEAKASCKARKRKERQESISSLCQDRKVIRSNSEERPTQKKHVELKHSIRRVSSSEDFQKVKSTSIETLNVSPNRSDKAFAYEDCEHEKRRSHERFSRPLALKSKRVHPNKRLKVRYVSRGKFKNAEADPKEIKKINVPQGNNPEKESELAENIENKLANFLQLHEETQIKDRSPSPVHTPISPVIDLKTLHEQVDCSEPLLSCPIRELNENSETLLSLSVASNRLLSSPRNSIIATHCIYLDPDIPQRNVVQNPVDERLAKLTKQINSVKKKIKKYEAEFEGRNGFKPSHADKLNDKNIKKCYADLSKLRKEQKTLNEVSGSCSLIEGEFVGQEENNLQGTINEIQKKLALKRELCMRSSNIEEMTAEQLLEEKIAIQKSLLYLESIHGRPNNKEDRDLVRPFYDRYRMLKRMVLKSSTPNSSGIELATIPENETMHFISPIPSQSFESETTSNAPSCDSDTDTSLSENLHSLSRQDLVKQLKIVTEEKKELRRTIKEFETNVQLRTGKMVQKEDKGPMEDVYMFYKKTKAKLRLLEALVGKPT